MVKEKVTKGEKEMAGYSLMDKMELLYGNKGHNKLYEETLKTLQHAEWHCLRGDGGLFQQALRGEIPGLLTAPKRNQEETDQEASNLLAELRRHLTDYRNWRQQ